MVWWNEDLARLKVEKNKAQNEASRSKGETEAEQERLRKVAATKKEEFAKAQMTAQREAAAHAKARQREEAAGSYTPADWMQCDNHDAARSQLEASSKRDQDDVVDG